MCETLKVRTEDGDEVLNAAVIQHISSETRNNPRRPSDVTESVTTGEYRASAL